MKTTLAARPTVLAGRFARSRLPKPIAPLAESPLSTGMPEFDSFRGVPASPIINVRTLRRGGRRWWSAILELAGGREERFESSGAARRATGERS